MSNNTYRDYYFCFQNNMSFMSFSSSYYIDEEYEKIKRKEELKEQSKIIPLEGDALIKELKDAIKILIEHCTANMNNFMHLPEYDEYYFNRLIQFVQVAQVKVENDNLKKAEEILKNGQKKCKYFNETAYQVLEIL